MFMSSRDNSSLFCLKLLSFKSNFSKNRVSEFLLSFKSIADNFRFVSIKFNIESLELKLLTVSSISLFMIFNLFFLSFKVTVGFASATFSKVKSFPFSLKFDKSILIFFVSTNKAFFLSHQKKDI